MTIVTKTPLSTNHVNAAFDPRTRRFADETYIDGATALATARPEAFSEGEPNELALGEFDAVLDANAKIYWLYMRPAGRPIMTPGLLSDAMTALDHLAQLFAESPEAPPARYTVMASRVPGIFNLGGDLRLFADLIRDKNRVMLEKYARACIEPQYIRSIKMNLPVISISLVQGDALGGGFECALADDLIIAEQQRQVRSAGMSVQPLPRHGGAQLPHPQDRRIDGGEDGLQRQDLYRRRAA